MRLAPRPSPANLVDLLRDRASSRPDLLAFRFLRDGQAVTGELTYGALDRRARAIGAALQDRCEPGARALLLNPPGLEFLTAFFGCLYAGVTAVPAYAPRGDELDDRIRAIAEDAGAAVAFCAKPPSALTGSLTWLTDGDIGDELAASWRDTSPEPDRTAHLQYTSGSTAVPKGVMVTHRNLLENLLDMDRGWQHDADSVIVSWLPHFHDMGLVYGLLEPIFVGVTCCLMPPVAFIQRPIRWLKVMTAFKGTHSAAPNFAYDLCARRVKPEERASLDLSAWRVAVNGAEPIRAETLARFVEAFAPCGFREEAFCPGYGLAEATLKVTASHAGRAPLFLDVDADALARGEARPPSNGRSRTLVGCGDSCIDTEVAIVDPETRTRCGDRKVGEIWVGGATVAGGYWGRTEETNETFGATIDGEPGTFLRTGDLGFLSDGQLFIVGRLKDLIIIRGQNHHPEDLELTVERCHPALRAHAGAAFSIDAGDEERLVIAQEVERDAREIDPAELAGLIRQAVAETHEVAVHDVVLLRPGSVPKTSSGKIRRHACRQAYLDGEFTNRQASFRS